MSKTMKRLAMLVLAMALGLLGAWITSQTAGAAGSPSAITPGRICNPSGKQLCLTSDGVPSHKITATLQTVGTSHPRQDFSPASPARCRDSHGRATDLVQDGSGGTVPCPFALVATDQALYGGRMVLLPSHKTQSQCITSRTSIRNWHCGTLSRPTPGALWVMYQVTTSHGKAVYALVDVARSNARRDIENACTNGRGRALVWGTSLFSNSCEFAVRKL